MLRIKTIRLCNYCGYLDTTFNFCPGGRWIPMAVFFGPNGCGKSTCLNAIRLLVSAKEHAGRDMDLLLRSLVHNEEYNPDLAAFVPPSEEMVIEGVFDDDGVEKRVTVKAKYWEEEYQGPRPDAAKISTADKRMVLARPKGAMVTNENEQEWVVTFYSGGFVRNDLKDREGKAVLFVDADNPINMKKFQVPASRSEQFRQIAEAIYGYPCDFSAKVISGAGDRAVAFFSDFILNKGGGRTKVHFKRMSAGEQKIATMIRILCNPAEIDDANIILIDNVELHVYFKRHPLLVEKLVEVFPDKQFLVTTHSAVIIQHVMERNSDQNEPSWLFDIEKYKPHEAMTI